MLTASELWRRLKIPAGGRVALFNPPPGYAESLGAVAPPEGESAEVVQLFAPDRATLEHDFAAARAALKPGGLFWVVDFGPREGELLPFKKGFAHFAVDAGVQVLPVALAGMKEIWLGKRL